MPKVLALTNVLAVDFEPTGKRAGDQYFNTTEKILYVYDGTLWSAVTGSGNLTSADGGTPDSTADTFLDGGQP